MSIDINGFYERQYPELKPFVGERFGKDGMPAILLIAESHYVPEDEETKQHLDAEKWYAGSSHDKTFDYIRICIVTSIIFPREAKQSPNKIHGILPREINNNGPHLNDLDILNYLAFYNFYLRPAKEIKRHPTHLDPTPLDTAYANAAFSYWVNKLNPTAIIFVSQSAWDHLDKSRLPNVPCVAVSHPKCQWWNRTCKKYGGRTGRKLFADFVKKLPWPQI